MPAAAVVIRLLSPVLRWRWQTVSLSSVCADEDHTVYQYTGVLYANSFSVICFNVYTHSIIPLLLSKTSICWLFSYVMSGQWICGIRTVKFINWQITVTLKTSKRSISINWSQNCLYFHIRCQDRYLETLLSRVVNETYDAKTVSRLKRSRPRLQPCFLVRLVLLWSDLGLLMFFSPVNLHISWSSRNSFLLFSFWCPCSKVGHLILLSENWNISIHQMRCYST